MVKSVPNFCCCAVDQEKAAFQRKRAVSALRIPTRSPDHRVSAPVSPHRPQRSGVSPPVFPPQAPQQVSPPQGGLPTRARHEMVKFVPNFCYCLRFYTETGHFWPICAFGLLGSPPKSPHHSGVSPPHGVSPPQRGLPTTACLLPERPVPGLGPFWGARNGQICPEFLLSWKRPFLKGNGPFLAHLPFLDTKWSNLSRIFAIVL